MATVIKPKRSSTPGSAPTTANLAEGEIAINLPDKKLFVRDAANNILTVAEPVIPAVEDAADIVMTGDLTVEGDFIGASNVGIGYYPGGPLGGSPQTEFSPYTPDANTNHLLYKNYIPIASNAGNPTLYEVTQFSGTDGDTFVGQVGWRHMGAGGQAGKDRYEIIHLSDDGTTQNKMVSLQYNNAIYLSTTDVGSAVDWRIAGGAITHLRPTTIDDNLTVNGVTELGKLQLFTDNTDINSMLDSVTMPSGDQLHNHLRGTLDYGANAIPNGAKSSITFSAKNDADGDNIVARFASQYDTGDNNMMEIEVSDNNGNFTTNSFSNTKFELGTPIKLWSGASDPANPENGWVYYNTTTDKMRLYAGGAWVDVN